MFGIGTRIAELRARRAEADLRLKSAQVRKGMMEQAYDAANVKGRQVGWARPHTSANTELQGALPFLRATSRDLVRNSPHASRAVRVLTSHVVGAGVRPRAAVDAADPDAREALRRITRDQWQRFVENCDPEGQLDWYGQERLAARTVVESGEAFRIWQPVRDGGRLFWRCRIVEGDLVDHLANEARADGSKIVQGVEFDAAGRRVAYHMFESHPGERYLPGGLRYHTRRVPASLVDHMYEVLRPGQVRGVSWFAPVATVLRDIDDLAEAEVVRKKLEACISMVVHNAHDDAADGAALQRVESESDAPMKTAGGQPLERMQPGMVLEARPGWSVEFNAPPASVGLTEHMTERLHAIAAGVGVTYQQMTGDLKQANYSSMRAGALEFNRLVDQWQADLAIQQSGRPAWRRVMEAAQTNGDLRLPVVPRADWTPPKRPWVDPMKDAQAAILQMRAGILSPQDVIEQTGRAPEDIVRELREWRDMLADAELDVDPGFGAEETSSEGDET